MLKLKSIDLQKTRISNLAVPVCEDETIHAGPLSQLVEQAKTFEEFHGKKDEKLTLFSPAGILADRVIFMGLGKHAELSPEKLRAFSGKAVKSSIKHGLKELVIAAPSADRLPMAEADLVTAMLEGACLGNHVFDRYKRKEGAETSQTDYTGAPGTCRPGTYRAARADHGHLPGNPPGQGLGQHTLQ